MTYPHVRAAFINSIAEEGTKAEAVKYLQEQWNETCALRSLNADMLAALRECVMRFHSTLEELKILLADHPIDKMQDEAANEADEEALTRARAAIAKATGTP